MKFPNNLIIQWGTTGYFHAEEFVDIPFPIVFPNFTLNVSITTIAPQVEAGIIADMIFQLAALDKVSFRAIPNQLHTSFGSVAASWIAIGC